MFIKVPFADIELDDYITHNVVHCTFLWCCVHVICWIVECFCVVVFLLLSQADFFCIVSHCMRFPTLPAQWGSTASFLSLHSQCFLREAEITTNRFARSLGRCPTIVLVSESSLPWACSLTVMAYLYSLCRHAPFLLIEASRCSTHTLQ